MAEKNIKKTKDGKKRKLRQPNLRRAIEVFKVMYAAKLIQANKFVKFIKGC